MIAQILNAFVYTCLSMNTAAFASIETDGLTRSRHPMSGDIQITSGTWSSHTRYERPLACLEALHPEPIHKGWARLTALFSGSPSLPTQALEGATYEMSYSNTEARDKILNIKVKWRSLRHEQVLNWRLQFSSLSNWTKLRLKNLETGRLVALSIDQVDIANDKFAVYVGEGNQFILSIASPSRTEPEKMLTAFYDLTKDQVYELPADQPI